MIPTLAGDIPKLIPERISGYPEDSSGYPGANSGISPGSRQLSPLDFGITHFLTSFFKPFRKAHNATARTSQPWTTEGCTVSAGSISEISAFASLRSVTSADWRSAAELPAAVKLFRP